MTNIFQIHNLFHISYAYFSIILLYFLLCFYIFHDTCTWKILADWNEIFQMFVQIQRKCEYTSRCMHMSYIWMSFMSVHPKLNILVYVNPYISIFNIVYGFVHFQFERKRRQCPKMVMKKWSKFKHSGGLEKYNRIFNTLVNAHKKKVVQMIFFLEIWKFFGLLNRLNSNWNSSQPWLSHLEAIVQF